MAYPRLELIAAVERNFGIGKNNTLPWSLPTEFAYFLKMTQNPQQGKKHAAILGRLNWESIPESFRPWKHSICFILSRTMKQSDVENYPDVYVYSDWNQIMEHLCRDETRKIIDRVWIYGGNAIYAEALRSPFFYRLYLTRIDANFAADVFFPAVDFDELRLIGDDCVPQGVQIDSGVEYQVYVYETTGANPLIE